MIGQHKEVNNSEAKKKTLFSKEVKTFIKPTRNKISPSFNKDDAAVPYFLLSIKQIIQDHTRPQSRAISNSFVFSHSSKSYGQK